MTSDGNEQEIYHFTDDCYCEIKDTGDMAKLHRDKDRLGDWVENGV